MAWKFFTAAGQEKQSLAIGPGTELDYVQITANATTTATTAATAVAAITGNTLTFDGSTSVYVEVFSPSGAHSAANQFIVVELYDGATDLGLIAQTAMVATAGQTGGQINGRRKLTPSAGAHQFIAKIWVPAAGTGTLSAGVGGGGVVLPAFLRVVKA